MKRYVIASGRDFLAGNDIPLWQPYTLGATRFASASEAWRFVAEHPGWFFAHAKVEVVEDHAGWPADLRVAADDYLNS